MLEFLLKTSNTDKVNLKMIWDIGLTYFLKINI